MTAQQLLEEVKALPQPEREHFLALALEFADELSGNQIPVEFLEAMDDFENSRVVPMETALNAVPPGM